MKCTIEERILLEAVTRELEKLAQAIKEGGVVPGTDHFPEKGDQDDWEYTCYLAERLEEFFR